MASKGPSDGDALSAAVLGSYGRTMFQVQVWEFNLACLTYAAHVKIEAARTAVSAARTEKRDFDRIVHLTQKATASEMRNLMRDAPVEVDRELIEEISTLIPTRDRLVHRYLFEELVDFSAQTLNPMPAPAAVLAGFGGDFKTCCERIQAETQRIVTLKGGSPPPEEVMPFVESTLAPLLFAQSRPHP